MVPMKAGRACDDWATELPASSSSMQAQSWDWLTTVEKAVRTRMLVISSATVTRRFQCSPNWIASSFMR